MPAEFCGLRLEQRALRIVIIRSLGSRSERSVKTAQIGLPQHSGQLHAGAAADLPLRTFGPVLAPR
jgi:hypothetical protein